MWHWMGCDIFRGVGGQKMTVGPSRVGRAMAGGGGWGVRRGGGSLSCQNVLSFIDLLKMSTIDFCAG